MATKTAVVKCLLRQTIGTGKGIFRSYSTKLEPIKCRAAVAWEVNKPLSIETVEVAPPKQGEVRVRIVASGVCASDAFGLAGKSRTPFPTVLGHEAAGIVESVGEGVTSVNVGDHVIPLFVPQCNECHNCKMPHTNFCDDMGKFAFRGYLKDKTTRFTCKDQVLSQYLGTSTFSEYTVLMESSVVKINPTAPLDKVCLIGCCFTTGYGSAINTANVRKGSVCAVWGLGGVGLSVVQGCKDAGARKIIGIDVNPDKFQKGKVFGCTDFINPLELGDTPLVKVLSKIGGLRGGVDYAFDCVGGAKLAATAFESIVPGGGVAVFVGMSHESETIPVAPYMINIQKTITGSIFGGWKGKEKVPELVNDYIQKKILLDELITDTLPLERINEAFEYMKTGKSIRTVITM